MNYTRADLAKLILSGQYTDEEIAFNDLTESAGEALRTAREDFKKVANILRPYGLNNQYVYKMIDEGLKS
jgi:endonuclease III